MLEDDDSNRQIHAGMLGVGHPSNGRLDDVDQYGSSQQSHVGQGLHVLLHGEHLDDQARGGNSPLIHVHGSRQNHDHPSSGHLNVMGPCGSNQRNRHSGDHHSDGHQKQHPTSTLSRPSLVADQSFYHLLPWPSYPSILLLRGELP